MCRGKICIWIYCIYMYIYIHQFGTFNFSIRFLTSSTQRVFGLPVGLFEMGFQECIALTILVSGILSICPSHPSLCALTKFIMFLSFILSNSWLVFICHKPTHTHTHTHTNSIFSRESVCMFVFMALYHVFTNTRKLCKIRTYPGPKCRMFSGVINLFIFVFTCLYTFIYLLIRGRNIQSFVHSSVYWSQMNGKTGYVEIMWKWYNMNKSNNDNFLITNYQNW
jgi:hypothetical protein